MGGEVPGRRLIAQLKGLCGGREVARALLNIPLMFNYSGGNIKEVRKI